MLVLALDTATPAITAALAQTDGDGVTIMAQSVTVDSRAHGELLAPAIEAVLGHAGVRPGDLRAIVAGVGPGPFTGLRVGLVTAATMSAALGIPTYGVCTLDVLGAAAGGPVAPSDASGTSGAGLSGGRERVLVATDARRKEVYWAVYHGGIRITDPAVDRPADVAVEIARHHVVIGVGEGAQRYADVLGVAAAEPLYPLAIDLVRLAAQRVDEEAPGEHLIPLYLRRPDAEVSATRKPVLAQGER